MLSDKKFRDRASIELRSIAQQVLGLANDREVYQGLEREASNHRYGAVRNPLLDTVRGAYTDATIWRLQALLAGESRGLCLVRILKQLAAHGELLHNKVSDRELAEDLAALENASAKLKKFSEPHLAEHERTVSAMEPTHRQLNSAIDLLLDLLKKYYWVTAEAYLDLQPNSVTEDLLSAFRVSIPELAEKK